MMEVKVKLCYFTVKASISPFEPDDVSIAALLLNS